MALLFSQTAWTSADEYTQTQIYFEVDTGFHRDHEAGVGRLALIYRPKRSAGFETSLAVDYFEPIEFKHKPDLPAESLSHLRLGAAYRWQWHPFNLTQEFGIASLLSDLPEYELEQGESQIFTSLAFGYQFNRNLELYSGVTYDFGNEVQDPSAAIALGLRFNFGSRPRSASTARRGEGQSSANMAGDVSAAIERDRLLRTKLAITGDKVQEAVLSAAEPLQSIAEEFDEKLNKAPQKTASPVIKANLPNYSIQVGSFIDRKSIQPFILKWGLNPKDLIFREVGRFTKVSFGRYDDKEQADIIQEQLSEIGIDCFVVKLR